MLYLSCCQNTSRYRETLEMRKVLDVGIPLSGQEHPIGAELRKFGCMNERILKSVLCSLGRGSYWNGLL
jgi:hypothetical protein